MSGEGFDPEDISELDGIFMSMIADNDNGYLMEFGISVLAAKELIELWEQAESGNFIARIKSWGEYTKIINELQKVVYPQDFNP